MDTLSLGVQPEEGVLVSRPSTYSPELREQAVELVRATGKTVAEVARDLQINDTTLGDRVKADRAERGEPDSRGLLPLTAEERAELTRLRRENAKLKTEREILEKGGDLQRVRSRRGDAVRLHRPGEGLLRRRRALPAVEGQPVGVYAWLSRPPSARAVADEVLTEPGSLRRAGQGQDLPQPMAGGVEPEERQGPPVDNGLRQDLRPPQAQFCGGDDGDR